MDHAIVQSSWSSTSQGSALLDRSFASAQAEGAPVILLFSVNASGGFCGVAEMVSSVGEAERPAGLAQVPSSCPLRALFVPSVCA